MDALPEPVASCVVYTPEALAAAIVSSLAGDAPPSTLTWLEPSVGAGVFLQTLAQRGVKPRQITAKDLARTPAPNDALACTERGVDFVQWARHTKKRFDRIVANPPYVAVRELHPILRDQALQVTTPDGHPAGHRANYWYVFLCASLSLLKPGGSLGFVLPAAWCYADYAQPLRTSIARWFRHVQIHRSERPLFEGIQEGSVVLIAAGYGHGPGRVREHMHREPEHLLAAVRDSRVIPRPRHRERIHNLDMLATSGAPLSEIMTIRIGAVTGDTPFFLMSETQRRERGIPESACYPVLSRAHHLLDAELTRKEWTLLRKQGQRVWLLAPEPDLLDIPAVRAYLALPPEQGGCHRDRCQLRRRGDLWYRPRLPESPDGFMSGMSHQGPWIAFRRMTRLTVTNTLYAIRFRSARTPDEQASWALSLLSTPVRRQLEQVTRRYPDGLTKLEPGDLNKLILPRPHHTDGAPAVYREAIGHLLARDHEEASRLADAWLMLR